MLKPQFILPIASELVVDLFAGGGGASTGIEQAIGRHVDIAINHDPEAVSLHQANHPQTRHFVSDVFEVDPVTVCDGQPVGLLWASPDCKHFSKAKGGKPVSKKIRSLAWVVVKWVKALRPTNTHPRVICLENVEEFQTWGPLLKNGMPCPDRKGSTFAAWKRALESFGYVVEHRELRACDYGAPTIRKRLFLVARRDGAPIVWPEPTHAGPATLPVRQKKLKPWRTAAECIDWSIPCPSIFERTRPLADATLRRIAKGVMRYVVESANPFIVPIAHYNGSTPAHDLDEPLRTVTANPKGGAFALVAPTLVQTGYGERAGQAPRALDLQAPLGTIVSGQKHALVAAFLAKHYTGVVGSDLADPVATVTSQDHHSLVAAHLVHMGHGEQSANGAKRWSHGVRDIDARLNTITASGAAAGLVTSHLVKLRGTSTAQAASEPLHTISAQGTHFAEVRAFLIAYYGVDQDTPLTEPMHTVTTKPRFGLVTVQGEARCLAWAEGYALAMHGSFTRDLDLIAIPWTDKACEADHLVKRITAATGLKQITELPGAKPHDRSAWTLVFPAFGDPRFIDLSVMPRATPQSAAARDVLAERERQKAAKGWTPEHDDKHVNNEIAAMACFYAMPPGAREWPASETGYGDTLGQAIIPEGWAAKEGDRRRELEKAGALILAEMERIDRARGHA